MGRNTLLRHSKNSVRLVEVIRKAIYKYIFFFNIISDKESTRILLHKIKMYVLFGYLINHDRGCNHVKIEEQPRLYGGQNLHGLVKLMVSENLGATTVIPTLWLHPSEQTVKRNIKPISNKYP